MNLKKKLISLLLSVGVITSLTSVNLFAFNPNMSPEDFGEEISAISELVKKDIMGLKFLESGGFEKIENILVNIPRYKPNSWAKLLINIKDKLLEVILNCYSLHICNRIDAICHIIKSYIYSSGFRMCCKNWERSANTYESFSKNEGSSSQEHLERMKYFCQGYEFMNKGRELLELYRKESSENKRINRGKKVLVHFKSACEAFKNAEAPWDEQNALNEFTLLDTEIKELLQNRACRGSQVTKDPTPIPVERTEDPKVVEPMGSKETRKQYTPSGNNHVDGVFLASLLNDRDLERLCYEDQRKGISPSTAALPPVHSEGAISPEAGKEKSGTLAPIRSEKILRQGTSSAAEKSKFTEQTESLSQPRPFSSMAGKRTNSDCLEGVSEPVAEKLRSIEQTESLSQPRPFSSMAGKRTNPDCLGGGSEPAAKKLRPSEMAESFAPITLPTSDEKPDEKLDQEAAIDGLMMLANS